MRDREEGILQHFRSFNENCSFAEIMRRVSDLTGIHNGLIIRNDKLGFISCMWLFSSEKSGRLTKGRFECVHPK
jgi:hypothetical protein